MNSTRWLIMRLSSSDTFDSGKQTLRHPKRKPTWQRSLKSSQGPTFVEPSPVNPSQNMEFVFSDFQMGKEDTQ
jgi:hypothetical protein